MMSRIYVANHLTLDGVLQGPGRPEEDTRGGFTRGGWAVPRSDDEVAAALGQRVADAGGLRLLLGHRSYDEMLSHWNSAGGPFKEGLNAAEKYVASRSDAARLPWPNSTLLGGDIPGEVAKLKADGGPDLCIMGSGELIRTLLRHHLIDELLLFIHPVVLGSGMRMLPADGSPAELELRRATATRAGVLIAHYQVR